MPPATPDRMMIAPNALANLALIVNLISAPVRAGRPLVQNTFHVRYDDELVVPLGDEADELRSPMHADARRLLHIGSNDLGHLVHFVGGESDQNRHVVDLELDHHDT